MALEIITHFTIVTLSANAGSQSGERAGRRKAVKHKGLIESEISI
jgi:hypothetical protein